MVSRPTNPAPYRYDIFVSYNNADENWARELVRRLRRFKVGDRPISVFFAPTAIGPGESIPSALSRGLSDSRFVVGLVTEQWIAAEWCQLEGEVALFSDPSARRQHLVPLLLQDCVLPTLIRRLRVIDARADANLSPAVQQIVQLIRRAVNQTKLQEAQETAQHEVLRAPLLPWSPSAGPSFDFLWPDLFFDPVVVPKRRPAAPVRFQEWKLRAGQISKPPSTFVVIGEPGAGKTTLLRASFLREVADGNSSALFRHSRQVLLGSKSLLSSVQSKPLGDRATVFIDGLDEVDLVAVDSVLETIRSLTAAGCDVFLGCRSEHFSRHVLSKAELESTFAEVLEIGRWTPEDVRLFIEGYASTTGDPTLPQRIDELFALVPGVERVVTNPLQLALVLYLAQSGLPARSERMREPYGLYSLFYDDWVRKEEYRGTGAHVSTDQIEAAHLTVARKIYEERLGKPVRLNTLPLPQSEIQNLLEDTAFRDLLILEESGQAQVVFGFRHDTLSEFLVARETVDSFLASSFERLDASLHKTHSDDVNRFVRSAFQLLDSDQVGVALENLSRRYYQLRSETGTGSADHNLRLREQLLYYIGRLPLRSAPAILREAFRQEELQLLRRSAALGAILNGDEEIENEFMSRMVHSPREDLQNRSFQLVYFGDVDADPHTFVDQGEPWSRVRSAIFTRLSIDDERSRRLRWWDAYTLWSFYKSRDWADAASPAEIEVLTSKVLTSALSRKATTEVAELLDKIRDQLL